MFRHLLTIAACLFLAIACEEDKEIPTALPPETQEGKNTFGCYIDGNLFVADNSARGFPQTDVLIMQRVLRIRGINWGDRESDIQINLILSDSILRPGTYPLRYAPDDTGIPPYLGANPVVFKNQFAVYYNCPFGLDTLAGGGSVTITYFDTNRKIISGRFEFRAKNSCGEFSHVTDGRFDIKYAH